MTATNDLHHPSRLPTGSDSTTQQERWRSICNQNGLGHFLERQAASNRAGVMKCPICQNWDGLSRPWQNRGKRIWKNSLETSTHCRLTVCSAVPPNTNGTNDWFISIPWVSHRINVAFSRVLKDPRKHGEKGLSFAALAFSCGFLILCGMFNLRFRSKLGVGCQRIYRWMHLTVSALQSYLLSSLHPVRLVRITHVSGGDLIVWQWKSHIPQTTILCPKWNDWTANCAVRWREWSWRNKTIVDKTTEQTNHEARINQACQQDVQFFRFLGQRHPSFWKHLCASNLD